MRHNMCDVTVAVTGPENRVSAILATGTRLATADLRLTVAGTTT